jgi:hypothetical protein
MTDEKYAKVEKVLCLLEEGVRIADEMAAKGEKLIGPEDRDDQIAICDGIMVGDNPELATRAKALKVTLENLKM